MKARWATRSSMHIKLSGFECCFSTLITADYLSLWIKVILIKMYKYSTFILLLSWVGGNEYIRLNARSATVFWYSVSSSNRLVSLSLFCHDHKQLCYQTNSCKQIKMPSIVTTQLCTFPHSWLISPDWPCSKFFPQRLRWPEITEGQYNWNRVTAKWASFHWQAKSLNSISLRCRLLRCAPGMCRWQAHYTSLIYWKGHNSFASWQSSKSAVKCQRTQADLISRTLLKTESYGHSCILENSWTEVM